ncbi:hypothetical protein V6L77_12570 [Pannonibacter sp. Pt2-lr]
MPDWLLKAGQKAGPVRRDMPGGHELAQMRLQKIRIDSAGEHLVTAADAPVTDLVSIGGKSDVKSGYMSQRNGLHVNRTV